MKFRASFFVALLLFPLCVRAQKISKESFDSKGKKRSYYLFVPTTLNATAPAPLLLLLHGSGRNGLSLVDKWKDLAGKEGIIIAGPDARDSQGWSIPEDGPDSLRDLVEALKKKYPIDPRRVYLFGHSAGAVFALNLAMMESEYFAAMAIHAGSWRDSKNFAIIDYARRKTPLAIFVGDRDQFFPLSSVKATEAALTERGFKVELSVMKGHDHWYYDLAPEINRNAWEFLKKHALNEDPRYTEYAPPGEGTDANASIEEINLLTAKVNGLLQRFFDKEQELERIDLDKQRATAAVIGRDQIEALTEGVAALQESVLKAEQLSRAKLGGAYPEYFSLLAQAGRKRIEMLEAMRERAQFLLSNQLADDITIRRNEARDKIERLHKESDELAQKAERLSSGKRQ